LISSRLRQQRFLAGYNGRTTMPSGMAATRVRPNTPAAAHSSFIFYIGTGHGN